MNDFDGIKKPAPQVHATAGPQQVSLITKKARPRRRGLKIAVLTIILIIVALGVFVLIRGVNLSNKIFVGQKTTIFQKLTELIRGTSNNQALVGEDNGQVNILLLGIGGQGHDGPYLTDTMIVAQIRPSTGEIALTSIPRDYLAELPGNLGQQKINSAFTYGFGPNQDWNKGGQWAIDQAEKLSGLSIPYFAVIDFSGFEKAVDQIGGVDVHVDRTFTDSTYPNSGTGYLPPITFTEGDQHFNGTQALQFTRSRHAPGIEGSDFARSQRQQKIIAAFEAKVFTNNVIHDAGTINNLLGVFADHFHTNMNPGEMYRVFSIAKSKNNSLLSLSLDPETGLICPEILASNSAYVLVPCPGKSESDVVNFFKNSFSIGKLTAEKSVVWLANSTGNKQAYDTAFRKLTDAGLTVYQLGYSQDNLPQTIVYEANLKPATEEFIENELHATKATLPPPGVTVDANKVDVIVILGANAPIEAPPKPYIAPPAKTATTTPAEATSTPQSTSTSPNSTSSLQNDAVGD